MFSSVLYLTNKNQTKPILEVIVGKTMEQSMLEVMEEEELENLREQQRKFQVSGFGNFKAITKKPTN